MTSIVQDNRAAVERLCRRFRVRHLELFGSAVGETFDPDTSDLDFLVDFEDLKPEEYADTYFGLLGLFNRVNLHQSLGGSFEDVDPNLPESVEDL